MSRPPSPPHAHAGADKAYTKRRDRPPALDFADAKHQSDSEARSDRQASETAQVETTHSAPCSASNNLLTQPQLYISNVSGQEDDLLPVLPRSPSATSSLDPYYFGVSTPSESPVQSSPMPHYALKTPEMGPYHLDPVTPGKDPASIDRRGLVGVGELATPRWARGERRDEIEIDEQVDEVDEEALEDNNDDSIARGPEQDEELDLPDSPWTIEAIDGEPEENDEVRTRCRTFASLLSDAVLLDSFLMCTLQPGPCARSAQLRMRVVERKSYTLDSRCRPSPRRLKSWNAKAHRRPRSQHNRRQPNQVLPLHQAHSPTTHHALANVPLTNSRSANPGA